MDKSNNKLQLQDAAKKRDLMLIRELLEGGANVNVPKTTPT
jgi:hypothetical protein